MGVVLEGVLAPDEVSWVRSELAGQAFVDGRETSEVATKKNLQLPVDHPVAREVGQFVAEQLAAHKDFFGSVFPSAISPPLFSRYEPGMEYPVHVDSALMMDSRADVSLTLFLSAEEDYDGGELEIESGDSERRFKLPAGDAIAYPTTTLHRVMPVTRGVRQAAVVWIQSLVRDPEQREILAELGKVTNALPNGPYADRVRRSFENLERMWFEL